MILVPHIPTRRMIEAAWMEAYEGNAEGVWKAMIEAWISDQKGKF